MSIRRLIAGALFGALGGGGGAVALIQAGWVASSASSIVLSAASGAGFGLVTTALARFKVIRIGLSLVAIGLSVITLVMAQTPKADALQERDPQQCVTAFIGDQQVDGTPSAGERGSATKPFRLALSGAETVAVEIVTAPRFDQVEAEVSIVEPVPVSQTIEPTNIALERGRRVFEIEFVDTSGGLGIIVDGDMFPLPFGTARVQGTFSVAQLGDNTPTCRFDIHFRVVTSALDSLAGIVGLAALAVGTVGLIALALTAGRTGSAPQPPAGPSNSALPPTATPAPPSPSVQPPGHAPAPPAAAPPPTATPAPPSPPPTAPPPPSVQPPGPAPAPPAAAPPPTATPAPPSPAPTPPPPPSVQPSAPVPADVPAPAPPAAAPPPSPAPPTPATPPPPPAAAPPPPSVAPAPTPAPSVPAGVGTPPGGVGPGVGSPAVVTPPTPQGGPLTPSDFVPPGGHTGQVVIDLRPERFAQMRVAVDGFPERGFIGGQVNELTFWIGPKVMSDLVAASEDAVPEAGRVLHLDARFEWPGGEANAQLTLPVDPRERSQPKFVVPVDIPADALRFGGTLYFWVRETGRLYEHVKVVGAVARSSHEHQPRLISIVEDRGQLERVNDDSVTIGACLIHEGNSLFWYTGSEPAVFDSSGFGHVLEALSSAVANLQARSGVVDWTDDRAVALLRTLAVEGAKLRYAVAATLEPGSAFQFYNHQAKSSIPLEWVYDRGHTGPNAILKPSCIESLAQGLDPNRQPDDLFPCGCPPAAALSPEQQFNNPVLCPWGFWGLAKMIERYDVEPEIVNNMAHPDGDRALRPISSILLGANESLDRPSGRPGEIAVDLAGSLAQTIETNRVYTWLDWGSRLASGTSGLVVTLPHQDHDSLQIGEDKLWLSQVPAILTQQVDGIILLLGCKTSQPVSEGFASFTRLFKDRAAVVIGSSATLVTSDAARLALGLVDQLLAVSQTNEPLGQAIVAARRSMFAAGLPIALAITAIGDADWRFALQNTPVSA